MNDEEIEGDEEAFALEDDEQEFLDPELGQDEEAFEVDDTLPSDDGGSQDEEIYDNEAFTVMDNHRKTYKDSRRKQHGMQAPEAPREPKVKAPPPQRKIHDDGADTFRSLSDERLFRRDLEDCLAEAAVIAAEERLYTEFLDPRTGVRVPSVFKVGEMAPSGYCPACGQSMVLRRNKRDDGLFFGCSRFNAGCRGTRKFDDVVEEYESRQQRQSPSSSGR